jgi:hypothetical protein
MSTQLQILRGEHMKEGDTIPSLRLQLFEQDNQFNLTDYTVSLKISHTNEEEPVVDTNATITQPSRGIVSYSWNAGETDNSGTYLVEVVATSSDGSVITFPNSSYAKLYIEDRL